MDGTTSNQAAGQHQLWTEMPDFDAGEDNSETQKTCKLREFVRFVASWVPQNKRANDASALETADETASDHDSVADSFHDATGQIIEGAEEDTATDELALTEDLCEPMTITSEANARDIEQIKIQGMAMAKSMLGNVRLVDHHLVLRDTGGSYIVAFEPGTGRPPPLKLVNNTSAIQGERSQINLPAETLECLEKGPGLLRSFGEHCVSAQECLELAPGATIKSCSRDQETGIYCATYGATLGTKRCFMLDIDYITPTILSMNGKIMLKRNSKLPKSKWRNQFSISMGKSMTSAGSTSLIGDYGDYADFNSDETTILRPSQEGYVLEGSSGYK